MDGRTIFVYSIFAIGVLFSSVTGSADDRFADAPSDEREVQVSAGPSEVNGLVGESVRLECTSAPPNNYELRWARADNSPLPRTAEQQDGVLIIHDADSDASGVYVCNAVSALTDNTVSNASVTVNIVESDATFQVPILNIDPERQTVREGGLAVIRCTSPTHPNATIKWRRAHNQSTSHVQVKISNNEIRIPSAAVEDRGVYICEYASAAGAVRVSSKLEIDEREPPVVQIYPKPIQKIAINGSAFIECRVRKGVPVPKIRWLRRGKRVSSSHVVQAEGVLRFTGVTDEDDGEYTCSAENAVGSMDAIAALEIISRPVVTVSPACPVHVAVGEPTRWSSDEVPSSTVASIISAKDKNVFPLHQPTAIEIESSLNETTVGNTLHLTCKVKGDASASTMWMKAYDGFENNVEIRGNVLNITDMQIANAGLYRCIASTKAGLKFMDYYLNISSDSTRTSEYAKLLTFGDGDYNHTVANVTKKTIKHGHNVDLVCDTDLDPPVNYSWIIHSYEKSLRKIVANTRTLTVTEASVNNSGIYFCKAVSSRATLRLATILTVEDENSIPAFAGNSYLALPPITVDSPERNDIEIHIKPKSGSGLILYTRLRDYPDWGYKDDFISFGLYGSFPEFRYDVGVGVIKLRGDTPLQMNKWHKVVLLRNKRDGFMQVNGASNFTSSSVSDPYNYPNSTLPLFVGGHPNYTYITTRTSNEFNTGFDGCIGKLLINSKEINLEKEALSKENVTSCDDCNPNPCLNDGFCQKTTSSSHYYCICKPGYSGENCQLKKDTCYADSCGAGQCLENEDGIECFCPLGKTGKRCEKRIYINVPASTKNSSLA